MRWRLCVFGQLQRPARKARRLQLFTLVDLCPGIDPILCVFAPPLQQGIVGLLNSVIRQFIESLCNLPFSRLGG